MEVSVVHRMSVVVSAITLITQQLDLFVEKPPLPDTKGLLLLRVHGAVGESGVI